MAKELPYFRFTASEWLTDDISEESYEAKGLFIDVLSYYWFKDCVLTKERLFKKFSGATILLEALFELEIIKVNTEDFVQINFLDLQYDILSEKRKKRQKSGKLGGLAKSSNATAKRKQKPSYKDKDKDKENNKDKREKGFTPPTQKEVWIYAQEKGFNNFDSSRFVDFYASKGWMVGRTKMKDWKACVRNWVARDTTKTSNQPKTFAERENDNLTNIINQIQGDYDNATRSQPTENQPISSRGTTALPIIQPPNSAENG